MPDRARARARAFRETARLSVVVAIKASDILLKLETASGIGSQATGNVSDTVKHRVIAGTI